MSDWETLEDTWLERLSEVSRIVIAFSGGLDSTVLLHWASQWDALKDSISLLHINHGLSPHATFWAKHCEEQAQAYGLPCTIETVDLSDSDKNLESRARTKRYEVFEKHLSENAVLLMAHHQTDQAETVLLRALRGTGIQGLSGIPTTRPLGKGVVCRPFLSLSREALEAYAKENQLYWVEDESNQSEQFDRNYLRHVIWPALKTRWPALNQTLSRLATHASEMQEIIKRMSVSETKKTLCLSSLRVLPREERRYFLREWLSSQNIPMPSVAQLENFLKTMLTERQDAMPEVVWGEVCFKRYQEKVFMMPKTIPEPFQAFELNLTQKERIHIELPLGIFSAIPGKECVSEGGFWVDTWARVSSRKTLKKRFQEAQIPPWYRMHWPLVFQKDHLMAIPSVKKPLLPQRREIGWSFSFEPSF